MSEDTMLVRMSGGDVVRRTVASRAYVCTADGSKHVTQEEPELENDEAVIRTFGDPIPLIIKVR